MTRQRFDNHSTEFGLWLRGQITGQSDVSAIDSKQGFTTTNIDYLWSNYKTKDWMFIEEKRFNAKVGFAQGELFKKIIMAMRYIKDPHYKGFHVIIFEKTCPDDGKIWLDKKEITVECLLKFLQFKMN